MLYSDPEGDKFYEVRGVKPPERIPNMTEDELEEKFEENRRNRSCEWRKRGSDVYCITCQNRHGQFVGTNYILKGTDDRGLPILVKL